MTVPMAIPRNPSTGSPNFLDVISGSNGAFSAAASYDLVTGLGSPAVNYLLPTLVSQP